MADVASVLAGRREELAGLERAIRKVGRGDMCAVGLRGEPGIGKSRLLAELAGHARERGLLVLAGRAAELERDLTFAPLADALEPLLREQEPAAVMAELESEHLHQLAAVLPAVGPLAEVDAAPASGERHRLARAVRALLELLAAERPLALLVDDVHWADPVSADVLALLLHRPPRGRVLLGLAARTGMAPGLEGALAEAVRNGSGLLLELGPLSREAAAALLPGTGPAARERLYRASGGNPFYLRELAQTAEFESEGAESWPVGVPSAVRAALASELAALRHDARRMLEGAAVAGDPFDVELAAIAADVEETVALAALDELLAVELVRPTERPRQFRFRHPLVRRAVYEASGGGWRLAAHSRTADALGAGGATPAQRAHHTERASRPGDLTAVGLLAAAADEVAAAAPATAAGWYENALRLLPDVAEHREQRLALLVAQGRALVSAGRVLEARDVLRRVLTMLPQDAVADRVEVVVALSDLEALWTDNPEEARRLLRAERAAVGDSAPQLAAALTFAMARERAVGGDHTATESLAQQAREAARAAGDPVLEAEAAATVADAAHCRLRRDDADALAVVDCKIAEAGQLVAALSDEQVAERLQMLFWLAVARLMGAGDLSGAAVASEQGVLLARRTGQGVLAPAFLSLRGYVYEPLGRLDDAEADEEEALESALVTGNPHLGFWASVAASSIALARGKTEAALSHGEAGWRFMGTVPYSAAGSVLADARLAVGDPQGALAALEAFGLCNPEMWTLQRLMGLEVAVRVLLALGRVEEAKAWTERAPAVCGGRRTGIFGAVIAHAEGNVHLARGSTPRAATVALAGAAAGEQGQAPIWAGRCRMLAGEALAGCGRADAARVELRRAAAELEALGAWGYRDAALQLLRRLGDRPRAGTVSESGVGDERLTALTPREREVATLVGEGHTNAQIAARLHLSERTVEKHVSNLLAKLDLSSRTGVVSLLSSRQTLAR